MKEEEDDALWAVDDDDEAVVLVFQSEVVEGAQKVFGRVVL